MKSTAKTHGLMTGARAPRSGRGRGRPRLSFDGLAFPGRRKEAGRDARRPADGNARHRARHAATDKALDWLESKQIKQGDNTGAWSTNQAFNALAMLAFMSSGHTPGRGKYGDVIEDGVVKPGVLTRGKKYMLSKAQPTGYISSGAMYEHGLPTLCLAEMYGMDPDPDLEAKLRKAVDLIVKVPVAGRRLALHAGADAIRI